MTPFEMQIELIQPMILPNNPIHLDGLCWWALSQHLEEEKIAQALDGLLAKTDGVYHASAMSFVATPERQLSAGSTTMIDCMRWEKNELLVGTLKTVRMDGGPYMRRAKEWMTYHSPAIQFYGLGEPEKIANLLSNSIMAVGRNSRVGPGRIGRIAWEETTKDMSHYDEDGAVNRAIPAPEGATGVQMARTRPPYTVGPETPCFVPQLVRRTFKEKTLF